MFLAKMAWRNLSRHRLRTVVSVAAIALAVLLVVFARGYVVGLLDTAVADHVYYNSGHIKVVHQDYLQQERLLPLDYPLTDTGGLMSSLLAIDQVQMVIPRIKFGAMVSTDEELISLVGWGVDPSREVAFTHITDYLTAGRMPLAGQGEIVMGGTLLAKLDRQVGDGVTMVYNTAFGSLQGATFTIVGEVRSGIRLLDELVFLLPLDEAQRLLDLEQQWTELLVVASDLRLVDRVLPAVRGLLAAVGAEYVAVGYKETSELMAFFDLAKLIYNQVYVFVVLLAAIVVINTMYMIVKERTREIGMMAALGLEGKHIVGLFVIEGGIMGVLGSLVGAVLGFGLSAYFGRVGMDYTQALSGMSKDIVFNAIVRPAATVGNAVFAFVLGVGIVVLACLFPARRAAGLSPTEAMRNI